MFVLQRFAVYDACVPCHELLLALAITKMINEINTKFTFTKSLVTYVSINIRQNSIFVGSKSCRLAEVGKQVGIVNNKSSLYRESL